MKKLILIMLIVAGCSTREEVREEQQEVQLQEEERARTGYSDEMGPGYDYGSTSSQ